MSSALMRKKHRQQAKLHSTISSSPPKLQPLSFPPEPIVDLTLPPYQPPSSSEARSLLRADRDSQDTERFNDLRQLNEGRSSDMGLSDNLIAHDDDNDAVSGGLVSAQARRARAAGVPDDTVQSSRGLLARTTNLPSSSNLDHHHYPLSSPDNSTPTITPISSSNLASNHRSAGSPAQGFLSSPNISAAVGVGVTFPPSNSASAPTFLEQPGLSSRTASRSLTALDDPSHLNLTAAAELPPVPPLPPHILMSSAAPTTPIPTHVQSDCGHGTSTTRSTARFAAEPNTIAQSGSQDKPKRRASLFARTFSLRNNSSGGPKPRSRPLLRGLTKLHDATTPSVTVGVDDAIEEVPTPGGITQSNSSSSSSNGLLRDDRHGLHLSPSGSSGSDAGSGSASGSGSSGSASASASGSTATSVSLSDSACASSSGTNSNLNSRSAAGGSAATSMVPALHAGSAPSFNIIQASISGQGMAMTGLMTSDTGHNHNHNHTHTTTNTHLHPSDHDQRRPTRPLLTPHPSSGSTDSHSNSQSHCHSHENEHHEGEGASSSTGYSAHSPFTTSASASPSGPSRSASFSASVLTTSSNSFTRWKRWRAGGKMGSGLSSRTSLGEELLEKDGFGTASDDYETRKKSKRASESVTPKGKQKEKDKQDHSRNSSWGDVAISLLVKDRDKSKGKGKEKEKDSACAGKKAKFTLGCESEDNLPGNYSNSGRSKSPIPPVPPLPQSSTSLNRDLTSSPSPTDQNHPSSIHRPPLLRRDAVISPEAPVGRRRWTLASVMTDEGISDESLVRELERMREVAEWARRREKARRRGGTEQGHEEGGEEGEEDEEEEMGVVWDFGMDVWERERDKSGGMLFESPRSESGSSPDEVKRNAQNDEKSASFPNLPPPPSADPLINRRSTSPSPGWLAAQRALLICRELILTERHYLSLLLSLLSQHTATPPPPLMLRYVEGLVRASAGVLAGMEKEPSVGGVSRAFLEREEEVTLAYVGWCGVVGGWFVDGHDGGKSVDGHAAALSAAGADPAFAMTPLKRTVSTWRKSMPSIASLSLEGGGVMSIYARREKELEKEKILEKDRSRPTTLSPTAALGVGVVPVLPPSISAGPVSMSTLAISRSASGTGLVSSASSSAATTGYLQQQHHLHQSQYHPHQRRKPPTVRELAILPTQRVMRYVLLYRDLLSHTPHTSPSRTFVERAVETACRIADKCDRAQGNAAFVASSSSRDNIKGLSSAASENGHSKSATTSPTSAVFPGSPPPSLSTGGALKKKRGTEVPVGTSVMGMGGGSRGKNVRSVSGVSLKSLSGLGWGKSTKEEHSSAHGAVPMVVNLGSGEREGAAATPVLAVAGRQN